MIGPTRNHLRDPILDRLRTAAKSNVMVFCCNLLKDIPVPNFMLNGVAIDKVSNCVLMTNWLMMMTWLGNVNKCSGQCIGTTVLYVYRNCQNAYRSESLRKLCVAYNNVFRKITFLPRDCSASLMVATRDLPTWCIVLYGVPVCLRLPCGSIGEIYCMYTRSR